MIRLLCFVISLLSVLGKYHDLNILEAPTHTVNFLEVEQEPACPAGTVRQTLPQSGVPVIPRNANFNCNTTQANCAFCAPLGPYTSSNPFIISPRCVASKDRVLGSWSSDGGSLSLTFGAWPNWDLTVSGAGNVQNGWARYEVCAGGSYAAWVVPISKAPPVCPTTLDSTAACTSGSNCQYDLYCCPGTTQCTNTTRASCIDGKWQIAIADPVCRPPCPATLDSSAPCTTGSNCQYNLYCCPGTTQCINTTWASCIAGKWQIAIADPNCIGCNNNLPQATTLPRVYPTTFQNPFTKPRSITCLVPNTNVISNVNSACKPCSTPPGTAAAPMSSGTSFSITSGCPNNLQSAWFSWAGMGNIAVNGVFQNMNYQGTMTRTATAYGWGKYEWCDGNGGYGSWVVFF